MAGLKSRLENFWYYYKMHTMVVLFLVIVLAVGVSQCAAREKYDYSVLLYMSGNVSENTTNVIADQLACFGTDQNGDGKVAVEIMNCSYGNNDTIRMNQIGKLQARLTMPQSILFIVDETCFSSLDTGGLFESLGLPDKDGKAFNLIGTELDAAIRNTSGTDMPANYYLCKRTITGTSFEGNEEAQKYESASASLLNAAYAELRKNR